jgi:hypothetical protein
MGHLIGKLLGKLLEQLLGKELMLRLLFGGMLTLFGGIGVIACIVSIRESLRKRRTPQATPLDVVSNGPGGPLSDPAKRAPIGEGFVLLPFAVALAALGIWLLVRPDSRPASAVIEDLGGKVTVDEKAPGRPIVKVSFREGRLVLLSRRYVSDTDLARLKPHLEALPQLRELDLCHADITDRGLSELRGLTQLKTLIVGSQTFPPTRLTEDAVSELRKTLPNTEIYFYKNDLYRGIDPEVLKQLTKAHQGQ